MTIHEIHDKRWRIEVLQGEPGWRTPLDYPESPLHDEAAWDRTGHRAVMEDAAAFLDKNEPS